MSDLAIKKVRFLEEAVIETQLPVILSNGCEFSELTGECTSCHAEIKGEYLRGLISRPIAEVVIFDAQAICATCCTIFSVHGRVRAVGRNMQFEWINKKGHWVSSKMEFNHPIKRFLGTLLNRKW